MPLPLILINNLSEALPIDDLGITLPAGPGSVLDVTGLFLPDELRQSDSLQEFVVLSGAVTISGSEGSLNTVQAQRYFDGSQQGEQIFTVDGLDLRDISNTAIIAGDNVTVVSGTGINGLTTFTIDTGPAVVTDAIVGEGEVFVTSGTNQIVVSGSVFRDSFVNITHQMIFSRAGQINNVWLRSGESTLTSDSVPQLILWDSELIGLNYTNSTTDTDVDVQIHVAPLGSGSVNEIRYTWEVRDARVAFDSLVIASSGIELHAGDKVGVFASTFSPSTRPQSLAVTLFFRGLVDATLTSGTENHSGDFT